MVVGFEWFVSLRYLLARGAHTFISLVTLISVVGVAVGVTALIVVIAVMNGFQSDLRDRILGVTSHVIIGRYNAPIEDYREVVQTVSRVDGVAAATPFAYTQVMLSSGRGVSGAVLRGLDPESAARVTNVERNVVSGSLADLEPAAEAGQEAGHKHSGIIIGSELAGRLGVATGDWVTVISPAGQLTPMGRVPKSKLFRVVGLFRSGMYEYDNTLAYISLTAAQKFLGIGDSATGVEVKVENVYRADAVRRAILNRLGVNYWVRDWMQMNRNLFSALKLEKAAMFVILTLIVLVAAFNIVSSLFMMVMEKTRDIAIMKAMGATRASIRKIFVLEGLLIGVFGTALGLAGGFGLCALLKRYKFIELPADVYYMTTLPVKMEILDVIIIAVAAIAISLAATLYPSGRAARLQPAEALRYE